MKIVIIDKVGLSERSVLEIATSLIKNREPEKGSFDYGLETHGAIGLVDFSGDIKKPIVASQTNRRKSDKSPIEITIEEFKGI
ncbi:hypothetical protein D3C87_1062970 [compost metagenome]